MAAFSVGTLTHILSQLLPEPHAGLLSGLLLVQKQHFQKNCMSNSSRRARYTSLRSRE